MGHLALFLGLGICLGVGGWQLAVWLFEIRDKNKKYKAASAYALERNKPLLVVGGPWGITRTRHWLNVPAHGNGDVCLDIDRRAIEGHPCGVIANVTHIPFSDKCFGAVFSSHLLEHLPTTDDAKKALSELSRVAEAVFIAYPSRQSIAASVIQDHHLWVWQKGDVIYLKQRGKSPDKNKEKYHSYQLGKSHPRDEDNSSEARNATKQLKMTDDYLALQEEASRLAQQLFGNDIKKRTSFTNRLLDICTRAQGKDFLLIHNPGGFGSTLVEHLLQWERSILEGVTATIERLGYSCLLTQYFRCGHSWWAHMMDMKEQIGFFFKGKSSQANILAAELKFITRHLDTLKVLLIGVSQGAAFSNAVMRRLNGPHQVYSIELGLFFPHLSRRVVTERTLAIDSNGIMPDPMTHRNLKAGFKAYVAAPFKWTKYRLQGKPEKFTHCINTPGHEYDWSYPEVQRQIIDFLEVNFGTKC